MNIQTHMINVVSIYDKFNVGDLVMVLDDPKNASPVAIYAAAVPTNNEPCGRCCLGDGVWKSNRLLIRQEDLNKAKLSIDHLYECLLHHDIPMPDHQIVIRYCVNGNPIKAIKLINGITILGFIRQWLKSSESKQFDITDEDSMRCNFYRYNPGTLTYKEKTYPLCKNDRLQSTDHLNLFTKNHKMW